MLPDCGFGKYSHWTSNYQNRFTFSIGRDLDLPWPGPSVFFPACSACPGALHQGIQLLNQTSIAAWTVGRPMVFSSMLLLTAVSFCFLYGMRKEISSNELFLHILPLSVPLKGLPYCYTLCNLHENTPTYTVRYDVLVLVYILDLIDVCRTLIGKYTVQSRGSWLALERP